MSNLTVNLEQPGLFNQREKGVLEFFANKTALITMENEILRLLKDFEGDILDNK